jgi:hypothetical protein
MLYDIFLAFKEHPLVSSLMPLDPKVYYGRSETRGETTTPHIEWVPMDCRMGPSVWGRVEMIIAGKRVLMEGTHTRWSQAEMRIYESDYEALERSILNAYNALYDVLQATGNFQFLGGEMQDREQISQKSVSYLMRFEVGIPMYRLVPLAHIDTYQLTVQ